MLNFGQSNRGCSADSVENVGTKLQLAILGARAGAFCVRRSFTDEKTAEKIVLFF